MNLAHKNKSFSLQRINENMVVQSQDNSFKLLAKVEYVIFDLKIFLL